MEKFQTWLKRAPLMSQRTRKIQASILYIVNRVLSSSQNVQDIDALELDSGQLSSLNV
jgi:hypothetical protein